MLTSFSLTQLILISVNSSRKHAEDHQREGGTRFRVTLPRHPGPTAEL